MAGKPANCRDPDTPGCLRPGMALTQEMTAFLVASFAAGMVSTVNPCGFAMLPAYLGFFLTDQPGDRRSIGGVTLAVASGFLIVFTTAGALLAAGIRTVVDIIPWLALAVGAGLVIVGVSQLRGRRLLPYLRAPSRVRKVASFRGMFGFGVSYAVASLSCTLPIFLSLVGGAMATRTLSQAIFMFVAYATGMAMVVAGITVLVAGGRRALIDRIRPLAKRIDLLSGWTMTLAGLFIVWYWATVLTSGAVALGTNHLVRWIDRASGWVTGALSRNTLSVAVTIVMILVLAYVLDRRRRQREELGSAGRKAPRSE